MFMMNFDLRNAPFGGSTTDLFDAAIEMSAWAESRGCLSVALREHHTSPDGYLPSPLMLASAIAARTEQLKITITAVILPFYDPVRLAEDMVVLDHISHGRVAHVLALGYRPEEYEHYGVDKKRRGRIVDEKLALLRQALSGEPFEHDGRRIHVTPAPTRPGRPRIFWGGGSVAAARRAGRYGLGFIAQGSEPGMREAYEESAREHGHEPGAISLPDPDKATNVFVADDVDQAWEELGPYLLHDATMYGAWNVGNTVSANISTASTIEELRAEQHAHRVLTVDEAVDLVHADGNLSLHPLCGGIPPAVAWPYLERVVDEVLPRCAAPQA
jgi:alkanesulfonate monooxygenase SsuD/methylene tetrahydromethanopterin reductase-like flavin-dependent oxidoreductase (luciferase family)